MKLSMPIVNSSVKARELMYGTVFEQAAFSEVMRLSNTFVRCCRIHQSIQKMFFDANDCRQAWSPGWPGLEMLFDDVPGNAIRDKRIHEAVREHPLQEIGDHIGLHFYTISIISKREAERSGNSKIKA